MIDLKKKLVKDKWYYVVYRYNKPNWTFRDKGICPVLAEYLRFRNMPNDNYVEFETICVVRGGSALRAITAQEILNIVAIKNQDTVRWIEKELETPYRMDKNTGREDE